MLNKKGYVQIIGPIIIIFVAIMVFSTMIPILGDSVNKATCQDEKNKISSLESQLMECQNRLVELGTCQDDLSKCEKDLSFCVKSFSELEEECEKKEQPSNIYYFIKVFSDKIILFDIIVLYHIQVFVLFLSIGITFTIKLFDINFNIQVLNKRNQAEFVRVIREHLIKNPWSPVLIVLILIFITNLIQLVL